MKKVPKLRFKEFSDEWQEKKLGEIGKKITLKNNNEKIKTVLTNSAEKGIVKQEDFFDKEITNEKNINNYYIVSKNDFVYNPRISKQAPYGPINKSNIDIGIVSPLYLVFNIKNENVNFLEKYFKCSYWYSYMYNIGNSGARSDRMNIGVNDFFNMPINIPSLQEQEKIANFLSNIDKKISLTEEKLELFREYKKGVMQKIFSKELRFKDSEGNDYPEWEERKFGEICKNIYSGKTINKKDFGKYKVYGSTGQIGWSNEYDYSGENILIARVGANAGNLNFINEKCGISDNTLIAQTNIDYKSKFIFYLLKNYNLNRLIFGSGQPLITAGQLKKLIFFTPILEEQEKIADFLSLIDSKIESIEKELEELKEFKRGLLQQMFV